MEGTPEIHYPCDWGFRIIGTHEKLIRQLVAEIAGDLEHTLEESNTSAAGNYVSLRLTVLVRDEEHRNEIHQRLTADESVKMVL